MTKEASNFKPHLLKGYNYRFWKLRMKAYIHSIDERAWMTMEECYLSLNKSENGVTISKPRSEWSTNEFELAKWHHRAMNAIFGGMDSRQFSYIQNLETVKEAWEALQVTNEGTKAVKKSRLQLLTTKFKYSQMCEEDKFVDFQEKLLDIANQCQAFGTPISGERLNWKILRSLSKRFKAKVTAIEERKNVDVMGLNELLGSLQTFKACLKPKVKNKGLALKVVKEASSSEDDNEIDLLVRKFRKFLRKGAKPSGKTLCFGDTKKDNKGKAIGATWSEDNDFSDKESSSDKSFSEEELMSNFVAFTTSHSIIEDVCQDSLYKEVDPNYQECLSDNPTCVDLLAKVKCLEEDLKAALREVVEKDDLIKLQVDELVSTTQRLLGEKNAFAKKL
ncbi:hypothetical protein LWI28_013923 [Acer negundo]|uniref:DUF4219 domain-containing protein n=1 Tax=Acer negundo TaxID=4023 RepID=A0AAD5JE04_ACENE|nr:hypothetical protein LWI28_013923 [Acer negundo]